MRSNIIKKGTADEVRCAVTELRLSETFMGVPQLSVKVASPTPIIFEIGDYITYDYNGVTYTLRSIPEAAKSARPSTYGEAFVYNLVFYSPMWDLRNAPFLDLVLYDNSQHFTSMPDVTTYEDVYGIAARVQANMDNMYPGKWEIRVVSGLSADSTLAKRLSETQDFSLSDGKCLDALSQVYSQWGVSFVYSYESGKHVITIGGAETQEDTTGLFMYGRGNGLKVIKSSVQNASEIATRLYIYGGTQNMQPRYYNGRTMEPEYIHASDASNPTITAICSGRRLLGDNMYVPNLMIPVSKWGRSTWYVWTASSHSQAVFTEVRNPSAGDDFAFNEPNIGASRNVISSVSSSGIVVNGFTYRYLAEVLYPDIRKAYIDALRSYLDKYGIRPATLRFDGSGEREDIHPSIKGLTIGDIRAGLGSGAEYYPSTSVYTDPDERVDKVLSCDNPADDGLNTENGNKYVAEDSISCEAVEREATLIPTTVENVREYETRGKTYLVNGYAKTTVTRRGLLDFRFPLVATVEGGENFNITAGVEVYKTDTSGRLSLIIQYTTTNQPIKGDPEENIYFGLNIPNDKISVDEGDILSISLWFQAVTDNVFLNTIKWTIPEFTMVWRYELSLESYFYIKLKQIGFDISQIPTNDGEHPLISMTSGQCGGYEFEIYDSTYNTSDDSWTLRCVRVQDGTLGQWFPNSIFGIEPDDTFVLLNIALPEVYITANEQRLYDAALAERLYEERPLLEPEIDSKVMAESPQVLRAGMWFSVKDTDLGLAGTDGSSYLILIDSVEVTDKPDTIRSFKVTLRNNKEDNVFVRMQRQIAQTSASVQSERRSQTKTSVSEVPTKGGGGGEYPNLSDFVTLSTEQMITGRKTFAEDVVFGADGGRMFIPSSTPGEWAMYVDPSEAIDGEEPQPGGGGGGLDEDELWAILRDTGTETIAKNHLPSDVVYTEDIQELLSGFATQDWVESRGYLTETALYGYATQDWVDDNFVRLVELPSLSKYLFWGASVSPRQYVSVTDGSGTSRSLSLSTHTHDKDDIEDFPTSWDWSDIDNTPTTLSGYGITDAYTDEEVDGLLEGYVTLGTAQEITGLKTFASLCTLAGGALVSGYLTIGAAAVNEDYPLYVDGDAWIGSCLGVTEGIDCQGYIAAGVLHIPSADGNRLYSLSVDPAGAVSGEDPDPIDEDALWVILQDTGTERISKNHLPSDVVYTEDIQDLGGGAVWYGQISSGGAVTKRGGTATLRVTHTTTGAYTISGLTAANVAAVTPMYVASGSISPVQKAYSAVIVRSMASLTVHMFDENGDKADYGFYLIAM